MDRSAIKLTGSPPVAFRKSGMQQYSSVRGIPGEPVFGNAWFTIFRTIETYETTANFIGRMGCRRLESVESIAGRREASGVHRINRTRRCSGPHHAGASTIPAAVEFHCHWETRGCAWNPGIYRGGPRERQGEACQQHLAPVQGALEYSVAERVSHQRGGVVWRPSGGAYPRRVRFGCVRARVSAQGQGLAAGRGYGLSGIAQRNSGAASD